MNLAAYDNTELNKNTYVNINRKELRSKEINFRPYYVYVSRYNKDEHKTIYYLVLLDDIPKDREAHSTMMRGKHVVVSLKYIWSAYKHLVKDCNALLTLEEHTDDGDIYKINI